ncbi:MAG: alcohol dehydrogenase catalytic domain-containing protein [Desulfobacterales bacterium]|nr:MAG: alcohol dehydrogenase catalytic domain-containing protein [Desulfobacterales bacterium]
MKALRYLAPQLVKTEDIEPPVCAAGEALVRVHSAGICGSDMYIFSGKHPRAQAPLVMGHEFAGEIASINPGPGPTDLTVGDKVTAYPLLVCGRCWACRNGQAHVCRNLKLIGIDRDGAFAEYVNVPLELLFKLPPKLSYAKGALVEPLAVAWHALAMAGEPNWQTAVVIGSGPIGLLVGLCLQDVGIQNIIMSDINAHRLKRSARLGFQVFNSAAGDLAGLVDQVTDAEGADVVFECAGSGAAALQMCQLVRPRGTVVVVSTHKEPHGVDLQTVNFRELTVKGTRVYTPQDYRKALDRAADLPFTELVSHMLDLDRGSEGFQIMQQPEDVCKVLLNPE